MGLNRDWRTVCGTRSSRRVERVRQLDRPLREAQFPNEASLLHLATALLCELSIEWLTGKIYLNMNPSEPPCD